MVGQLALAFGDCRGGSSRPAGESHLFEFFLDSTIIHLSPVSLRTFLPFPNRNYLGISLIGFEAYFFKSSKCLSLQFPATHSS